MKAESDRSNTMAWNACCIRDVTLCVLLLDDDEDIYASW